MDAGRTPVEGHGGVDRREAALRPMLQDPFPLNHTMQTELTSTRKPYYDSAKRGPVALEELRGLVKYRELLWQLVRRDIVSRYKRSTLGIAWTMLYPLGTMIVLTVVFEQLFHRVEAYPAYLLSGLVVWNFFGQTTSAAMHQMVWGSTLLHRIYMPRTTFVVSAVGTGLVNLALSLIPLIAITLLTGKAITWSILFLPISLVFVAAFALGVGLLISAWAIYFPDVAEMYSVALLAWMYLTPIIYPIDIVPESYRFWFFHLNPMYYMVELFRQPVYYGALPAPLLLLACAVISLVTLGIGWIVFTSRADEFTYRT